MGHVKPFGVMPVAGALLRAFLLDDTATAAAYTGGIADKLPADFDNDRWFLRVDRIGGVRHSFEHADIQLTSFAPSADTDAAGGNYGSAAALNIARDALHHVSHWSNDLGTLLDAYEILGPLESADPSHVPPLPTTVCRWRITFRPPPEAP